MAAAVPQRQAGMAQHQPHYRLKMTITYQHQPTKAQDLLHRAASLMDERGQQYDQPSGERSMLAAVTAFNAIAGYHLTEADGFLLMALLKMVRDQQRETPHRDSIEDLVAYASLYGEARLHGEAQKQKLMQDEAKVCEEQKWPHEGQHYTREQLVQKIALAHQSAQEARYAGR